jgi:DNA-binding NtrC family response regulator
MSVAEPSPAPSAGQILIVEDDREMARFLGELLREERYDVAVEHDGASALARHKQQRFDLTITDLMMPGMKGTELVARLKELDPDHPVLLITAFGTIESAVRAMQAGALNYITKPFHSDEILLHVRRALEHRNIREELERLRTEVRGRYQFSNLIGRSQAMQQVFDTVAQVSDLPANILIVGESGTGKELIARAIHFNSARASGPLVTLNCAAVPAALLESELFGYVRGAFTDAKRDRRGLFQEASGGTLFLDEIGEIAVNLQAKLLRAIEEKEVRPLGANKNETVDARLISATNRDLEQHVRDGNFRQDLYYRLNVIRIELPPLRRRTEDIPLLVEHFIRKFSLQARRKVEGIDNDALSALMSHRWPGNVRELEHTIERAVLLGRRATIGSEDLPPAMIGAAGSDAPLEKAVARGYTLHELERDYIRRVMEITKGNKTEAARILGVDRTTLYRKLEEYKVTG